MISIIIPTHRQAKHLFQTLKSIFDQTYQDFEIIIVDDGLFKEARKNLKERLKDKDRIKIIEQEHLGAPAARNRGFRESEGEFLFFCDDDVVLKKDALEKMIRGLNEHPEASYVYSDFYFGWKIFRSFDFDKERLKKTPYISAMSLIRRQHFSGWDESLKKFQDWDLWLTMLKNGYQGYYLREILFKTFPRKKRIK